MFKKKIELIKSINYPKDIQDNLIFMFGVDNRIYRSLRNLFEAFWIHHKKELYLVGGVVRDLLLNKTPKDYDLTTNASIEEIREICAELNLKTFDSGVKHGTLTIIDDFYKTSYECTVYRKDGKYTDSRHPDTVEFVSSLEEDLKRRDFTINSFAYNFLDRELVMLDESYLKDLEYGIIRTVGNPEERFTEDALRMLRALRFSAQLNFSIDTDTFAAIKKLSSSISQISKERIRDELTKIIISDNPQVLELFIITGLEKPALGSTPLSDMLNCLHENPYHYTDVFHHTMDAVKVAPKTFETRWAALFHDMGKPITKTLKDGTTDHYNYHGHPEVSADMALALMDILKFSNDQKDLIYKYVKYHDSELVDCKNSKFKRILNEIGIEHFVNYIKLKRADAIAHQISRDTKWAIDAISKIYDRFNKVVEENQALTVRDLDINGFDLMDLGLSGKQVGDCLNYLLEEVLEDASVNKNEQLKELAKDYFLKISQK